MKIKFTLFNAILVLLVGCSSGVSYESGYPEPLSWDFPDVVKSARQVSEVNLEGRLYDENGLAYLVEELEALPIKTMSAQQLQVYADVVTNAFPDAAFEKFKEEGYDSCSDYDIETTNETSFANMAYIALNASQDKTRTEALACFEIMKSKI